MKPYRPCPFCGHYKLIMMVSDDRYFCYIACQNKGCVAMGPMADYDEIHKAKPSIKDIKELAREKWNKGSFVPTLECKFLKLKNKSHDAMMSGRDL